LICDPIFFLGFCEDPNGLPDVPVTRVQDANHLFFYPQLFELLKVGFRIREPVCNISFCLSPAVNYRFVVVPVAITVVIFLDDYRVPISMFAAITDNGAVVISVTVTIMASADCHSSRSDTNLFRARRHYSTNACNGGNYQGVFHRVFLTLLTHAV
jgi:hypothetical protein